MTRLFSFNRSAYAIAITLLVTLVPVAARAQGTTSSDAEQTFFDFQVEQVVKVKSARTPMIPERLRNAGFEGQVLVQYVVDERGVAQMSTFKVLKSTDNELTDAVRRAVNMSSYFPAEFQGKKVKQLVQQPFIFKLKHL